MPDPEVLFDFSGGMNAGLDPTLIGEDQFSLGVNVSTRRGFPETRPGFRDVMDGIRYETSKARAYVEDGRFQGALVYNHPGGDYVAAVFSGVLVFFDVQAGFVFDGSRAGDLSEKAQQAYFAQAGRFLIVQDGVNLPLICDGLAVRRSDPTAESPVTGLKGEVPRGTHMAYVHHRLFVAMPNSDFFVAGDISLPNDPDNVLRFTETQYLASGGALQLPHFMGRITGMSSLPSLDTSTGIGPLLVFGERGVAAFSVQVPRTEWPDTQLGRVVYTEEGAISGSAIAQHGLDVFWRAPSGISNLRLGVVDLQEVTVLPFAREARPYIDSGEPYQDRQAYAAAHNRRVLFTVRPRMRWYDRISPGRNSSYPGTVYSALLVVDLDASSGLRQRNRPVFDGIWTGADFTGLASGLVSGRRRLFVFHHTKGKNGLLVVDSDSKEDHWSGKDRRITSFFATRALSFGDGGATEKLLRNVVATVMGLRGEVSLDGYYAPEGSSCWYRFESNARLCAKSRTCGKLTGCHPPDLADQRRTRVSLAVGGNRDCDEGSGRASNGSHAFTVGMRWTGRMGLKRLFAAADDPPSVDALSGDHYEETTPCGAASKCCDNPWDYAIETAEEAK